MYICVVYILKFQVKSYFPTYNVSYMVLVCGLLKLLYIGSRYMSLFFCNQSHKFSVLCNVQHVIPPCNCGDMPPNSRIIAAQTISVLSTAALLFLTCLLVFTAMVTEQKIAGWPMSPTITTGTVRLSKSPACAQDCTRSGTMSCCYSFTSSI